jgi:hypothetical protein
LFGRKDGAWKENARESDGADGMSRLVKSFNGDGRLLLRGGDALVGRHHIDVFHLPVRRIDEVQGRFVLDATATWANVVEGQFVGDASIAAADGQTLRVTLGGIVGREVAIVGMEPVADRAPEL